MRTVLKKSAVYSWNTAGSGTKFMKYSVSFSSDHNKLITVQLYRYISFELQICTTLSGLRVYVLQ